MSENKGELISRSALGVGKRNPDQFVDPERAMGWNDLLEIINAAPAVYAVEVVRCKDCKNKGMCCHHNGRYVGQFDDDDFCSYGERKGLED